MHCIPMYLLLNAGVCMVPVARACNVAQPCQIVSCALSTSSGHLPLARTQGDSIARVAQSCVGSPGLAKGAHAPDRHSSLDPDSYSPEFMNLTHLRYDSMVSCDSSLDEGTQLCAKCHQFLTEQENAYEPGDTRHFDDLPWAHDAPSTRQCATAGCRLCCLFWHHSCVEKSWVAPTYYLEDLTVGCEVQRWSVERLIIRLSFYPPEARTIPTAANQRSYGRAVEVVLKQLTGEYCSAVTVFGHASSAIKLWPHLPARGSND